jgi:hypothetical protein
MEKAKTERIPIKISVTKALTGILALHCLHFPLKKMKEKTGNKSFLRSCSPHEKQMERPFQKESPVLYLSATTKIKLPKTAPNKKIIIPKMYCIVYIIPPKLH